MGAPALLLLTPVILLKLTYALNPKPCSFQLCFTGDLAPVGQSVWFSACLQACMMLEQCSWGYTSLIMHACNSWPAASGKAHIGGSNNASMGADDLNQESPLEMCSLLVSPSTAICHFLCLAPTI